MSICGTKHFTVLKIVAPRREAPRRKRKIFFDDSEGLGAVSPGLAVALWAVLRFCLVWCGLPARRVFDGFGGFAAVFVPGTILYWICL